MYSVAAKVDKRIVRANQCRVVLVRYDFGGSPFLIFLVGQVLTKSMMLIVLQHNCSKTVFPVGDQMSFCTPFYCTLAEALEFRTMILFRPI